MIWRRQHTQENHTIIMMITDIIADMNTDIKLTNTDPVATTGTTIIIKNMTTSMTPINIMTTSTMTISLMTRKTMTIKRTTISITTTKDAVMIMVMKAMNTMKMSTTITKIMNRK
jgi:hypothetical protein